MKVLITGHTSGLGAEIWKQLGEKGEWANGLVLVGWSLETGVDLACTDSIDDAVALELLSDQKIDVVINCAGINFIDWHEETPDHQWDNVMGVNARAIWLVTKKLLRANLINSPGTILNIVSNASHVPMTNSAAYNASKGAAHILTLQMARELKKRHNITVFGVSPNKMHSTAMSAYIDARAAELRGWTPEEAKSYQLASLPAGEETDPTACAEFIAFLLSKPERHKFLAGCILPYGA